MNRRKLVILFAGLGVVALLALAGYQKFKMMPYPIGYGMTERSPDGELNASVMDMEDLNFWGERNYYVEFKIIRDGGALVNSLRTETFTWFEDYPVPMRGEEPPQVIFWETNSSAVLFRFQDKEIRMGVPQQ